MGENFEISKKSYLKKYLSKDEKKKNKKKKKVKALSGRVKIIDDDLDFHTFNVAAQEDIMAANEDAPIIVDIIDERPMELRMDEFRKGDEWTTFTVEDEKRIKAEYNVKQEHEVCSPVQRRVSNSIVNEGDSIEIKEEDISDDENFINGNSQSKGNGRNEDNSPPRKNSRNEQDKAHRQEKYDNISPPRIEKNSSTQSTSEDVSFTTRTYNDSSPPRRKQDDDNSPPRKRGYESPPKRQDNDKSPRRRSDDISPPRRKRNHSNSPPRKRNERNNDYSPPRKNKNDEKSSHGKKSQNDFRNRGSSPDRRKGNSSQNKSYSPPRSPRRGDYYRNEARHNDKTSKHTESDGKVRKSRWGGDDNNKLTKTLDGKTAGLQNAKDLVKETQSFKKREEELFKNMSVDVSGVHAQPVMRDRKTGKIRDLEKEAEEKGKKAREQEAIKEKYDRWGKGVKQVDDYNQKLNEDVYEMTKPLARYADDEDLEKYLKEQEREGDPMLAYIRKKKKKTIVESGKPLKPQYEGEFMPNRFGIRPGHKWDGVDRSSGYEKKWFEVQNSKLAQREEIYKWSTEDM